MFIVIFHALQFATSSEFCFAKPTFPSRGRLSNKSFVLYYNITEDGLFFVNSTLSSAHRQSLFQTTRLSRGFHFTKRKRPACGGPFSRGLQSVCQTLVCTFCKGVKKRNQIKFGDILSGFYDIGVIIYHTYIITLFYE